MSTSKKHVCLKCNDEFKSKYNLKRHLETVQCRVFRAHLSSQDAQVVEFKDQQLICHICKLKVPSRVKLISHLNVTHLFQSSIETDSFSSMKGRLYKPVFFFIILVHLLFQKFRFLLFSEFLEWKEKTQIATNTSWVSYSDKSTSESQKTYFRCN